MSCSSTTPSSPSSTTPPLPPQPPARNAVAAVAPVIIPPPPQNMMLVRRMSPQEDLLATLMGIDLLVQQRQRLIEGLVERHGQMTRRNEIGKLAQFSKDIDAIIKMRNPTVSNSSNPPPPTNPSFDWQEFHPRDMEDGEGIRSLQRMLSAERREKRKRKTKTENRSEEM